MEREYPSIEQDGDFYCGNLTPLILRKNTLPDSALREWIINVESAGETSSIHYTTCDGKNYDLAVTRDATEIGELSSLLQEIAGFMRLHKLVVKTLGLTDGTGPVRTVESMVSFPSQSVQYESSFSGNVALAQTKVARLYTLLAAGKLKDQKVVYFHGTYVSCSDDLDELEAIVDACYATD